MNSICETERLILREFVEDDGEAFIRLNSDPLVTRFTGDKAPASLEEARTILRDYPIADYGKYGFGRWAVILKSSRELIGFAGLKYLDDLKEVDVGYRLQFAYWGMGLATEASRPAMAYGFDKLALERIIGLVDPDNVASVNVLQKLGLAYAGMTEYHSMTVAKYALDRLNYVRPA